MHDNIIAFPASPKASRPAQPSIAIASAKIVRLDPTPFGRRIMARIDAQRAEIVSERMAVSDDDWYRALGERLRAARVERGISEQEAANAGGTTVPTWRRYEVTGKGRTTFPIIRFAKQFGISLNDLIRDPD